VFTHKTLISLICVSVALGLIALILRVFGWRSFSAWIANAVILVFGGTASTSSRTPT
jgi:hypothetical protein